MHRSEELKKEGNDAFVRKDFNCAIGLYSEAVALDPSNAVLYSNRSACYLQLCKFDNAERDAYTCVQLDPNFWKGHYRLVKALMGQHKYSDALAAAVEGTKQNPDNDMLAALPGNCKTRADQAVLSNCAILRTNSWLRSLPFIGERDPLGWLAPLVAQVRTLARRAGRACVHPHVCLHVPRLLPGLP